MNKKQLLLLSLHTLCFLGWPPNLSLSLECEVSGTLEGILFFLKLKHTHLLEIKDKSLGFRLPEVNDQGCCRQENRFAVITLSFIWCFWLNVSLIVHDMFFKCSKNEDQHRCDITWGGGCPSFRPNNSGRDGYKPCSPPQALWFC